MDETTTPYYEQAPIPEPAGLILNQDAQYFLNQAGKWARFLGIVGFIFSGIIALIGLFAGSIFATVTAYSANPLFRGSATALTVGYLIIAGISFLPALFLFQFGSRAKLALLMADSIGISGALHKLKSFFKFYGILIIIVIALDLLIFLGAIAGMLMMHR